MIEFEEYKSILNDLKPKLEELRAAFASGRQGQGVDLS